MLETIANWSAYLRAGLRESERETPRHHARTGRPLGSAGFIAELEARLGRRLKKRKPGPAKSAAKPRLERQNSKLAGKDRYRVL